MIELDKLGFKPLHDQFVPCKEEELTKIEEVKHATIPSDYKEFVLKYGDSFFSPSVVIKTINAPPKEVSKDRTVPFSKFYGGKDAATSLLEEALDGPFIEYLPESMIAIADDIMTNQILLCIKGDDIGKLYFWYRDGLVEPDQYEEEGLSVPQNWQHKNLTLVAESFTEFLKQIQPDPMNEVDVSQYFSK